MQNDRESVADAKTSDGCLAYAEHWDYIARTHSIATERTLAARLADRWLDRAAALARTERTS